MIYNDDSCYLLPFFFVCAFEYYELSTRSDEQMFYHIQDMCRQMVSMETLMKYSQKNHLITWFIYYLLVFIFVYLFRVHFLMSSTIWNVREGFATALYLTYIWLLFSMSSFNMYFEIMSSWKCHRATLILSNKRSNSNWSFVGVQ